MAPRTQNLTANIWGMIAPKVAHANLMALRGTSTQARQGASNKYYEFAKPKALRAALRSSTATTIRPLVRVLRREATRNSNVVFRNGSWTHLNVKLGRYKLVVRVLGRSSIVMWESPKTATSPGFSTVAGIWDMRRGYTISPNLKSLPGGITVGRLLKAAYKEAYNAQEAQMPPLF